MIKRSGFTLIELLVVVSIIGLLATLSVVSFNNAQVRARDAKRVADIRTIISAFAGANADDSSLVLCLAGCNATISSLNARVSAVDICTTCTAGAAGVRSSNYVNMTAIKDPKATTITACAGTLPTLPGTLPCDYTIAMNSTPASTTIGFVTEGGTATAPPPGLGLGNGNWHYANQSGIVN